jgi:spore germination cell wall hydrolase CwlJ-like protein
MEQNIVINMFEPTETEIQIVETEPPTEPPTESTEIETEPTEEPTEPTEAETEPQPWWTEEELDMLAALIHYEAGSNDCTNRHQQLVGQVVINRVNSDEFPNTIYDVIMQKGQYGPAYKVLYNMGNRNIVPQRCYDNALAVLNGEVDCPDDIVWQAEFIQGEIYEACYTSYSITYFCHR